MKRVVFGSWSHRSDATVTRRLESQGASDWLQKAQGIQFYSPSFWVDAVLKEINFDVSRHARIDPPMQLSRSL